MSTRSFLITVAAVMTLAVVGFCNPAYAQTPIKVGIQSDQPALHYLPLIAATRQGLFERQGLTVEIIPYDNAQTLTDDLVKGAIDFTVSHPLFPAVAREFDQPIKILGVLTTGSAHYAYAKDKKFSDISKIETLKDHTIGMFPDDYPLAFQWMAFMKDNTEVFDHVDVEPATPDEQHDTLSSDSIAVAFGTEPYLTQMIEKYNLVRSFPVDRFLGDAAHIVISGNIERLKRNVGVVKRFMAALQNSLITLSTDDGLGVEMSKSAFPNMTTSELRGPVLRMVNKESYPLNTVLTQELWHKTLPALTESGYLLEQLKYEDIVDNRFNPKQ